MVAETLLSPHVNAQELGRKYPTKGAPVRHLRSCELMMYNKRLRELSLFSLETRRLRGSNSCLPPSKGYTEDSQTFSEVHNRITRGNRQKLQQGNLDSYKAKFFTVKAIKHWSRSTERLQSPSLKIFRTWLDKASEQPDLTMKSAPDDLQRSLPT